MQQPQFDLFNIKLTYILLLGYYEDIVLVRNKGDSIVSSTKCNSQVENLKLENVQKLCM